MHAVAVHIFEFAAGDPSHPDVSDIDAGAVLPAHERNRSGIRRSLQEADLLHFEDLMRPGVRLVRVAENDVGTDAARQVWPIIDVGRVEPVGTIRRRDGGGFARIEHAVAVAIDEDREAAETRFAGVLYAVAVAIFEFRSGNGARCEQSEIDLIGSVERRLLSEVWEIRLSRCLEHRGRSTDDQSIIAGPQAAEFIEPLRVSRCRGDFREIIVDVEDAHADVGQRRFARIQDAVSVEIVEHATANQSANLQLENAAAEGRRRQNPGRRVERQIRDGSIRKRPTAVTRIQADFAPVRRRGK